MVDEQHDGTPTITWAEARRMNKKTVGQALRGKQQQELEEYAETMGITQDMTKATRQYVEWSAAAELRMLSTKGVLVRRLSQKDIDMNCGRGLPWQIEHKPVGPPKTKRIIEEQAWEVGAENAFESDLLGTIAEILIQMYQRKSQGRGREAQYESFLKRILKQEGGRDS